MTAEEFLSEMAQTANTHNLEAHMNLISKDVPARWPAVRGRGAPGGVLAGPQSIARARLPG